MKHEIYFTREKTGLGHRTAASVIRKAAQKALDAEKVDKPCIISVMLTDDEGGCSHCFAALKTAINFLIKLPP